jgi:coenzyme F420-0:L-glutamate ligase/coenzyme F420-1:gamma-L-glutamate ligase
MEVFAVPDVPEIRPGEDVARLVAERVDLREDDVVVIASTIVSKAEGRIASLDDFEPGQRARSIAERIGALTDEEKDPRFAQAVLEESADVLTEAPFLLTVTHFGHVCVNAGIDRSNVGSEGELLLLPRDPSERAAAIADGLPAEAPSVIVSDTCGRPFRLGQRGVAIGWAGLPASRDWRGEMDRDGHELEVTVESVVDELAATANLVSGEGAGGTPVVVIRDFDFGDHDGSDDLFRSPESDLVRQALRSWTYEGSADTDAGTTDDDAGADEITDDANGGHR